MAKPKSRSISAGKKAVQPKQASRIPLVLLLGGAVIVAFAAFMLLRNRPAGPVTPQVAGAAKLQADQQVVNLGDVKLGTNEKVDFRLTDVGGQPVRFAEAPYVEVKEGC